MKLPRKDPRTEGELQRWFVIALQDKGYLVYKFASPAKRGVPDLCVIDFDGSVFFVEMKSPCGGGILSPLQRVQIRKMLDNNAEVYISSSISDCVAIEAGTHPVVRYAEL